MRARVIVLLLPLAWLLLACGANTAVTTPTIGPTGAATALATAAVPTMQVAFPTPTATATLPPTIVPSPTIDVAPTQTRAAELAQIATLTAPTATPTALPPTLTIPPTATAPPPTATSAAAPLDYAVAQQVLDFRNRKSGAPIIAGVTGDGIPEALFVSYPKGDCGRCTTGYVTVPSGKRIPFDSEQGYGLPTVKPVEGNNRFTVTETIWRPDDYGNTPSTQRYLAYGFRPASGDFTLVSTSGPTITTRWRTLPVPPEMLRTGTDHRALPPTPPPSGTRRVCYELQLTLNTVTAAQLDQWISETWPRDNIQFVNTFPGLTSLSNWKRQGETRNIMLFIPPQSNQPVYIDDCDDLR